jgi:hypothetical protein
LVVGGIIVGFVVAVLVWPGEREPEYQGKKLSEWIDGKTEFWHQQVLFLLTNRRGRVMF